MMSKIANGDQAEAAPAPAPTPTTTAAATEVLVNGEKLDKWPQDLYIPPDALEVFLDTFQGPLDLLLYLIRRQNLDILDIPVARITRQYMEYVALMRRFRLDLAAEYLVMAATLAEIKSRMLLPRPVVEDDEDGEDPRAALVRRLQEYEQFSRAAREMDVLPQLQRDLYLVSAEFVPPQPVAPVAPTATLAALREAFADVLARCEQRRHWHVDREALSVREKMTWILERITRSRFLRFEELLAEEEGRMGLVVSFMAILELARDRTLVVVQDEPFAPIHLKSITGSKGGKGGKRDVR